MAMLPSITEKTLAYRVLRYTPNLVRDEWLNIGVLVFDPETGERRLRMIEEPEEYAACDGCTRGPTRSCCGPCATTWKTGLRPRRNCSTEMVRSTGTGNSPARSG